MPVMDGYTATREIRKNPAFARTPILAMTANAMAGDREKVLEAGMNDHIAKPLNVAAMFATMAKWITPHASSSAAAQGSADAMTSIVGTAVSTGARAEFDMESAVQQLETLLRDNDAAATDVLDAIRTHSTNTRWATALQQIDNAMDNFDFDTALEALQRARTP